MLNWGNFRGNKCFYFRLSVLFICFYRNIRFRLPHQEVLSSSTKKTQNSMNFKGLDENLSLFALRETISQDMDFKRAD